MLTPTGGFAIHGTNPHPGRPGGVVSSSVVCVWLAQAPEARLWVSQSRYSHCSCQGERWKSQVGLAYELIGFHNAQTWGSKANWDGPDVWEVPVDENKAESGIEALEEGRCH